MSFYNYIFLTFRRGSRISDVWKNLQNKAYILYVVSFLFILSNLFVFIDELLAHGGRTDGGCHNNSVTRAYHCHSSEILKNGSSVFPSNQTNSFGESNFNKVLAAKLDGKTEVRIPFQTEGSDIYSEVIIDIETMNTLSKEASTKGQAWIASSKRYLLRF